MADRVWTARLITCDHGGNVAAWITAGDSEIDCKVRVVFRKGRSLQRCGKSGIPQHQLLIDFRTPYRGIMLPQWHHT
ncbi:protein of unknown function [Candidatus Methylomirabilis oxygeniifera]|uniref:Uncharacterized protein n=1 Tax=Methylomirabilis oxygeniifera TaxID=671143 RepID=D5MLN6_METO1|nr:protein of unknown function [Candidatus Methylomirabilis oxyfera]